MNLFALARPILFALDPERAHHLTIAALRSGFAPAQAVSESDCLRVRVLGLDLPNPVGLAAGFDKNAQAAAAMLRLGFGFVEAGTVTPRPQPGNPRPRVFRLIEDGAVINRLGFNGVGHERFAEALARQRGRTRGVIGVNVGANKDSADPALDYVLGITRFAEEADYLVVNISSPNTPGLRDLQNRAHFAALLGRVQEARRAAPRRPPLVVKIAPDLAAGELEALVETALDAGIDGLVVSNTTVQRPPGLRSVHAREAGGLSGRPLFAPSTAMLKRVYRLTGGRLPLIGVGGIASGADAYAKIRAGASLVQLYTGLIYGGPALIADIVRELDALAVRDGLRSIAEAVGADVGAG